MNLTAYLEVLGESVLVVGAEFGNVFDELFDRNGLHVVCRGEKARPEHI